MRRLGLFPWLLVALLGAGALVWLYLDTLRRVLAWGRDDLTDEGILEGVGTTIGDTVRAVGDAVKTSDMPARWGGGIRQLNPEAQPFFAALFREMEARGYQPVSHYPHADYNAAAYGPGPRALDIRDRSWPRNAWQEPNDQTIPFYRTLGEVAQAVGLVWGGTWKKYHGSDLPWARRWREVADLGDMLHVEWRQGAELPAAYAAAEPVTEAGE